MIKQVLVVRHDLHMRLGKAIAQGAHAAMLFLVHRLNNQPSTLTKAEWEWMTGSMTKICVRVENEDELLGIVAEAGAAGLTVHTVTDSGRTEFRRVPTLTCCAIGPDEAERIDAITGRLKVL
jgi:PTH2 family peptidyl-tRNA hydrolase